MVTDVLCGTGSRLHCLDKRDAAADVVSKVSYRDQSRHQGMVGLGVLPSKTPPHQVQLQRELKHMLSINQDMLICVQRPGRDANPFASSGRATICCCEHTKA